VFCRRSGVGENGLRTALWGRELGRGAIPFKAWPSPPASGGSGLDKGLPPDPLATNRSTTKTVRRPNRKPAPAINFKPLVFDEFQTGVDTRHITIDSSITGRALVGWGEKAS